MVNIIRLPNWLKLVILVAIGIVIFALIKGCQNENAVIAKYNKLDSLNSVLLGEISDEKRNGDHAKKLFQDSLEFERGQNSLIEAQKQRTEDELDKALKQNKELIAQHKLAQYTDTTATLVPHGFIVDCEECFTRLESSTNITLKYKSDYNKLQDSWNKQDKSYQDRLKTIDAERASFNNRISAIAKQQQEELDRLKPHGRLYLSWSILLGPLPKYAGAGLMYQTKRNLIIGGACYYGSQGYLVAANIHFPLSLKIR